MTTIADLMSLMMIGSATGPDDISNFSSGPDRAVGGYARDLGDLLGDVVFGSPEGDLHEDLCPFELAVASTVTGHGLENRWGPDLSDGEPAAWDTMGPALSLDDWLAAQGDAPGIVADFDATRDALLVVYDAKAHPAPVLGKRPADTGAADTMLLLDGLPLAVITGGAALDLAQVSLVPEAMFPVLTASVA